MDDPRLTIRLARSEFMDRLAVLVEASIAELQKPFLSDAQIAASRTIMGVDTQLIEDGTYFVVEADGALGMGRMGGRSMPCG